MKFLILIHIYVDTYVFKPLKGIVRVLPLFSRSYLNRGISLFLHSNWSSEISIEKSGVKVVILRSSLLDLFPVFELLIQTSKNYTAINHDIDRCLWGDLRDLDGDMRVIIDKLGGSYDPYVKKTLLFMEAKIDAFWATNESLQDVNGLKSYRYKYLDYYICTIRIEFLSYLVQYMSPQDFQTFEVAKDTIKLIKVDFDNLYRAKVEASQILNNLNHSKLMMEVRWLLLNKPFDP